jgi:hypothetical protein
MAGLRDRESTRAWRSSCEIGDLRTGGDAEVAVQLRDGEGSLVDRGTRRA